MKRDMTTTHYFYQDGKLQTVKQAAHHRTVIRGLEEPLAEHDTLSTGSKLFAADTQNSVLATSDGSDTFSRSYTPHGHDPKTNMALSLLGFNGTYRENFGLYLLGNGYRAYSPQLTRFQSPDNLSPFLQGGINAYAYCLGDPINRSDPSGHFSLFKLFRNRATKLSDRQEAITSIKTSLNKSLPTIKAAREKLAKREDIVERQTLNDNIKKTEAIIIRLRRKEAGIRSLGGTPDVSVELNNSITDFKRGITTGKAEKTNVRSHIAQQNIERERGVFSLAQKYTGHDAEISNKRIRS